MTDALLAVLILALPVLTFILKSSGALTFLAVCAGLSMLTLAGHDINHFLSKVNLEGLGKDNLVLILLIVPAILTVFFTIRQSAGKVARLLQTLAALSAGLLLALTSGPSLSQAMGLDITKSNSFSYLQKSQAYIVIIGSLYCLILVWLAKSTRGKKHK